MKKLMFAATVAAAMAGFAVESQVVGYTNKGLDQGWNYTGAQFVPVTAGAGFNLQDLQMDTSCNSQQAMLTTRTTEEDIAETFIWFKKNSEGKAVAPKQGDVAKLEVVVPEGKNGLWIKKVTEWREIEYTEQELLEFEESGEEYETEEEIMIAWEYVTDKEFENGSGFVLQSNKSTYKITSAGQVSDDDIIYPNMQQGWNYGYNPFPASLNIQDMQMDTSCNSQQAMLTTRTTEEDIAETFLWFKKNSEGKAVAPKQGDVAKLEVVVPEGKNGLWIKKVTEWREIEYTEQELLEFEESGEEYETEEEIMIAWEYVTDRELDGGDGFVLQANKDTYSLTLVCPIDL